MVKRWSYTAAVAVLAVCATLANAQPAGEGRRPRFPASRPAEGRQRGMMFDHLAKELSLTEEQKPKVHRILQSQRQALENWRRENAGKLRDLQQKVQQAQKSHDQQAMKAAHDELGKLVSSRQALHENFMKQLADVLTPEQMEKARTILGQRMQVARKQGDFLGAVARLNLTDEQRQKIKQIQADAQTQLEKATTPDQKRKIAADAFKKINDEVLTEQQRQELKKVLKDRAQQAHPEGRPPMGPHPPKPGPGGEGPTSKPMI